ncbi:MAG: DUF4296 domain-containing protein [Bacteroidetes bacterium]|nr:DUF4296 domain-containing protein [Bacteroidota bacterium]
MKHFTAVLLLGLLCSLLSCSPPERSGLDEGLPADSVISEKKMMALLIDVHLLEGGLMIQRNKGEQDSKWNHEAYRKLFLRYHVTQSQFVKNLAYYQKDPKNFTKIYDTVLQRIDRLRKPPPEKTNALNKSKKPASGLPRH